MTRDDRLLRLERIVNDLIVDRAQLAERITELEVQMRFGLNAMKMAVPNGASPLLDASGHAPSPLIVNGWIAYRDHGGRDLTLTQLEAEFLEHRVTLDALALQDAGDTRPWQELIHAVTEARYAETSEASNADADRGVGRESGRRSDPASSDDAAFDDPPPTRH